jgi:hypothetical protein
MYRISGIDEMRDIELYDDFFKLPVSGVDDNAIYQMILEVCESIDYPLSMKYDVPNVT